MKGLSLDMSLSGRAAGGGSGPVIPTPTATATMTQLAYANQIFQRDTLTGGGQSVGQGKVPVAFSALTVAGTLNFRCSSGGATRGDLQSETVGPTVASTGAQTVSFTGVDAGLRWFYLDVRDANGWTNGTTLIGMGDLTAMSGQSLATYMLKRPNAINLSVVGVTPSTYTRVYCTNETYNPTTLPSSWELPSDAGNITSAGCAQFLNLMATKYGCNQGLIGHAVSGSSQSSWQPLPAAANANFTQFKNVTVNGAGNGTTGTWRFEIWYQGHDDAQSGNTAGQYQADMATRVFGTNGYAALNGYAGTVVRIAGAIPNNFYSTPYFYGPMREMNAIRKGAKAASGFTYVDVEGLSEFDGVHPNQAAPSGGLPCGVVELANCWYRAIASDNVGPSIASATRSGQTITVTMNNPGTNLVATGNWYKRFNVYPTGMTITQWVVSGGSYSGTGNTLTLTLAADPGDGTVLDLWLGAPQDGDAQIDPSTIMIRDDRVDGDGITQGRTFKPSTVATTVAAPNPGGTQNAVPGGIVTSQSYFDMTPASATYTAGELLTGFGTALNGGSQKGTANRQASFCPMTIAGFFVVPSAMASNSVLFGAVTTGVQFVLDTAMKLRLVYHGQTLATSSALTVTVPAGHLCYIVGQQTPTGAQIYVQDITAGTAGTRLANSTTAPTAPYGKAGSISWEIADAGTNFFAKATGTGLGIFHVSFWDQILLTFTSGSQFFAPATPYVGNEGMVALYRLNSGDGGKDAVRYT